MSALLNFAFDENLVRVVMQDENPWFVAADICRALHISDASKAAERLDDDERGTSTIRTPGGEQSMIIICEAAVYKLAFTSRKPEAKRFTRWVAHEVLPSIRRTGHYGPKPDEQRADPPAIDGELPLAERVHRLKVVMAAYRVHGRVRAIQMWRQLGLPPVPDAPRTPRDDGYDCIAHLLQASVVQDQPSIRDLIEAALDEDEQARALLVAVGIKPYPHEDGVLVANNHPALNAIFAGTPWDHGYYARALRRLPGVTPMSGFIGKKQRGTWIPASLLDKPRLAYVA